MLVIKYENVTGNRAFKGEQKARLTKLQSRLM